MKKIQWLIILVLIALFAGHVQANAQTFHKVIRAEVYGPVFCLEKVVTGYWVYQITYHVDKKTGEISNVRWTVKEGQFVDEDGNAYKLIDTGNDNLGVFHAFWNTVNGSNEELLETYYPGEGYSVVYYEENGDVLEDNWMEGMITGVYEGVFTNTFKLIGKNGEKVSFKEVTVYHVDAHGNVVTDFSKTMANCNW
ncbi:MAG: hypothetical protein ACWGNV_11170 [Bacteroidales bacterium]